ICVLLFILFFFFQAEDGIRDFHVTGVQTCALPIYEISWIRYVVQVSSQNRPAGSGADKPLAVAALVFNATTWGLAWWPIRLLRRSEERRVGKECRCRGAPKR